MAWADLSGETGDALKRQPAPVAAAIKSPSEIDLSNLVSTTPRTFPRAGLPLAAGRAAGAGTPAQRHSAARCGNLRRSRVPIRVSSPAGLRAPPGAQWPAGRPLASETLGGNDLAQLLLGVLTGGNGPITILLGLLSGGVLRRKLVLQAAKCLIPSDPLMSQLGLKRLDRRAGFLKQGLRLLASGDLLAQGLPGSVDPVDASSVIVVAVDDSNGHLTIANKAMAVGRTAPGGAAGGTSSGADDGASRNPRARRICSSVARRRSSSGEESDIERW